MNVDENLVKLVSIGAALVWIGKKILTDLKGISKKSSRIIEMLNRPEWADSEKKKNQAADLIGPGK